MKKLIVAGCICMLFACSNTNEFDANLDSKVSKASSQPAGTQANTSPMPLQNQQVSSQPVVTTVPATTNTQITTTTAPGMNPAHGEPGHRCDIPVGAPLNSAPKSTAKTTTASGQNIVITPTQAKTAPGMNPPHGQPGHRCDIAVGAPLNSAPATTPSQVIPVKSEESKTTTTDQWKADVKPDPAKKDSSGN